MKSKSSSARGSKKTKPSFALGRDVPVSAEIDIWIISSLCSVSFDDFVKRFGKTYEKKELEYFSTCRKKMMDRDFVGSLQILNLLLAVNSVNKYAYHERAICKAEIHLLNESIDDESAAIQLDDETGVFHYCRGRAYLYIGENAKSEGDCDEALNRGFDHFATYECRGIARHQAKENEGALSDFRSAFELSHDIQFKVKAAECLIDLDRHDEAYLELFSLGALEGKSGAAQRFALGKILQRKGRLSDALEYYDEAIALDLTDGGNYVFRGHAKMAINIQGAIEDFTKAIELSSDYLDAYLGLSFALVRDGRSEDALDYCNQAVQINPQSSNALMHRALAKYCLQDNLGALKDCQAAQRMGGKEDLLTYLQAELLIRLDRLIEARQMIEVGL
jgi:tetratricopeptide (TPR) repeat protein